MQQGRVESLSRSGLHARLKPRQSLWYSIARHAADGLTLTRGLLGVLLIVLGVLNGKAALAQDVWILVLAWSTDMLDGRIARALHTDQKSWLGKNDVYIDLFVSVAALAYLTLTGLLALGIAAAYLLIWGIVFLRRGIPPLFAQIFQNPIYAFFLFLTLRSAPAVLVWMLPWALVALAIFWRRWFELLRGVVQAVRRPVQP
jgi:phosphatidylglycerophosphate synthase